MYAGITHVVLQLSFGYEGLSAISANTDTSFSCAGLVLHMCLSRIVLHTIVVRDLSFANSDYVYTFTFANLALHELCANGALQVELTHSILQKLFCMFG